MKPGDLVRARVIHPHYFGGDIFESWESHEGELPILVGMFPNDALGLVLEVIDGMDPVARSRFYHGTGVKVFVGALVGWVNGDDLERV
jgi:hypothetical protein